MKPVWYFGEVGKEVDDETLHTLCFYICARNYELKTDIPLRPIDAAPDDEECRVCGATNNNQDAYYQNSLSCSLP